MILGVIVNFFSIFLKEIIIYISGFLVHKLTNTLTCDTCKNALYAVDKVSFLNSLISLKVKKVIKVA